MTWEGKRTITVVSACMRPDGTPCFDMNAVEVTQEEYENGLHYAVAEDLLAGAGYEEPFVHFADQEAPRFLIEAVKRQVADATIVPDLITDVTEED